MNIQITDQDLSNGYDLLKKVIDRVISVYGIEFIASDLAPNDFNQFLVYSGGDHGHLGNEYNVKFRAVHDSMHLSHDLTFSYVDEKKLSDITSIEFASIAYNVFNCTHFEMVVIKNIINAEIKGQIEYHEKNKEYVKDQSSFINDYLKVENV